MMSLFALPMLVTVLLVVVGGSILWIWMMVDCLAHEPAGDKRKVIWFLIILFTHWMGALVYLLMRRTERIETLGR